MVPLEQRPDQPAKVAPVFGVADKVTAVPTSKNAELDIHAIGQVIVAGAAESTPDPVIEPEPLPAFMIANIACPGGANACPTRDLIADISDEFTAPDAPTSNINVARFAANPDRDFTALTSFASTTRVLFTSPSRKPIDADA